MGHEPSLAPDITLFVQMGIFFLSWLVLHQLVFKPYLALLELRHAKTTGLKEQAIADEEQALQIRARYESFMKEERKKISAIVDEEKGRVAEEEREIVQKVRTKSAEDLRTLRGQVQTEYDRARKELLPHVGEYSSHIASKLVGYRIEVPNQGFDISKATAIQPTVNG